MALMLEAERRGILPAKQVGLLSEARRRGLVGQQPAHVAEQEAAPQVAPTTMDRAAAGAAGVNSFVAGLIGLPVDTVRKVMELGKLAAAVSNPATNPFIGGDVPDALQPHDPARDGNDFLGGDHIRSLMNQVPGRPADIPRPDDPASRYVFAAGQGAGSALIGPAAGARVIPSLVSGVTGAEAAQVAAESGADPATQAVVGLAGSVAPGAARAGIAGSARALARGGEEGRQRVEQNIQSFKDAGTTPSIGQAGEGRLARATESLLSRTPGGAGRMVAKGERQAEQMGSSIERLANTLAPRASGEQAGRAIQRGVSGDGGFLEQFKTKSGKNYDELDKFVKPTDMFAAKNAQAALKKLTTPIKGAEKTSGQLINTKLRSIGEALEADLAANKGVLPYRAVKDLRTMVGNELADSPLGGDIPSAQLKQVYAALSSDMEAAATKAGPAAQAALARANTFHKAGMKRIEVLSSVVEKNGGPEAVFRAATSGTKEGATTLRSVMQSLPKDAQKVLTASVLRRLGRATAGRQDDLGEKFSTETFLTNWNSMSPQAKAVLFDRYGAGFRQDMDSVARVASNLRDGSAVFRNPSGTGQAAIQAGAIATGATAVVTGNWPLLAAVLGGITGANLSARIMTNPAAVQWLAKTTKAPQSALPALVAQAANSGDADLKELATLLQQQPQREQNQ